MSKNTLRRGVRRLFLGVLQCSEQHHHCIFFRFFSWHLRRFWLTRPVFQLSCSKSEGCACCLLAPLLFLVAGHEKESSCCESGKRGLDPETRLEFSFFFLANKRNKTMRWASCIIIVLRLGADFYPNQCRLAGKQEYCFSANLLSQSSTAS